MAGKIITVAQQKGGAGKTTLCANLATALVAKARAEGSTPQERRIAILDTDPQGSLGRWFMSRCETLGEDNVGLRFRTASAWGARYEARELARDHDFVIIDTPPKMGVDGRPSIDAADLVLIPVTASPLDIWATEPTQELAERERKPILALLNRVSQRARITDEIATALRELELRCANARLCNRVLYAESMSQGLGVLEVKAKSPAAEEVAALCAEILAEFSA